jgi:hypothetical protein
MQLGIRRAKTVEEDARRMERLRVGGCPERVQVLPC